MIDGVAWIGGGGRRSIAVDYLHYNEDGTIQPFDVTNDGLSKPPSIKGGEEPDDREDVTISFILNYAGSPEPPVSAAIKKGDMITISKLPQISCPVPWIFLGWFTAAIGGERVDGNTVFEDNAELHAQWIEGEWFSLDLTQFNTTQSGTFGAAPSCKTENDNSLTAEFIDADSQALTINLTNEQRAALAGLDADQAIQVVIDGTAAPNDYTFRYCIGSPSTLSSWNGTQVTSYMPGLLSNILCQTLNFTPYRDSDRLQSFILQLRGSGHAAAVTVNIKSIRILYDPEKRLR